MKKLMYIGLVVCILMVGIFFIKIQKSPESTGFYYYDYPNKGCFFRSTDSNEPHRSEVFEKIYSSRIECQAYHLADPLIRLFY